MPSCLSALTALVKAPSRSTTSQGAPFMSSEGRATKSRGAPSLSSYASSTTLCAAQDEKHALQSSKSEPNDTSAQLEALRSVMKEEGLDCYIVPSEDAHASEYTAKRDQRRAYISGFTGSTGTAVIGLDKAHLFTDGRYHVQAAAQLDKNWELHKVGEPGVLDWEAWLVAEARKAPVAAGLDARLVPYTTVAPLLASLTTLDSTLHFPSRNLIDQIWTTRPAPELAHVHEHPLKYAGRSAQDKLAQLARWIAEPGAAGDGKDWPKGSAYFTPELDQIAWLLNARGASIPCTPVFPAYLVVRPLVCSSRNTPSYKATLFISPFLLLPESDTFKYVAELDVEVRGYDEVWEYLLRGEWKGEVVAPPEGEEPPPPPKLVAGDKASWAVVNAVGDETAALLSQSPLETWKAVKNATEQHGMRQAYLRDGAHWVRWAAWLDEEIRVKRHTLTEWQAAVESIKSRARDPLYAGDAYEAISASGENAALPHYETPEKGSRIIDSVTPYLMDAGGQYLDGTCDTTRTVHFGKPSQEHKRAFTRVLQGHIALATAVFPVGTTGPVLDALARAPLWKDGYAYLHGTGHGIGSFLQVHEGPQGFSKSSGGAMVPAVLQPGMCLSDEPGFYEAGKGGFGIRIESVVMVEAAETHRGFGGKDKWLRFARITQVPIDRKLVDHALLSPDELAWLTKHNEDVRRRLLPLIKDDKRAVKWLQSQ